MSQSFYLDTEFIEGKSSPKGWRGRVLRWLDRRGIISLPRTIQLVSIGIVAGDGREYYAISTEFNPEDADDWVKENVLAKLPDRYVSCYDSPRRRAAAAAWKSNQQIAQDIVRFVFPTEWLVDELNAIRPPQDISRWDQDEVAVGLGSYLTRNEALAELERNGVAITPTFYGYYADYDWVVFCWLFGRMISLPKGFPMYCTDLKQEMDRLGVTKQMKQSACPDPVGEHDALVDARWNQDFHQELKAYAQYTSFSR